MNSLSKNRSADLHLISHAAYQGKHECLQMYSRVGSQSNEHDRVNSIAIGINVAELAKFEMKTKR